VNFFTPEKQVFLMCSRLFFSFFGMIFSF